MALSILIVVIIIIFAVFTYFICCHLQEEDEYKSRSERSPRRFIYEDSVNAFSTSSTTATPSRYPNTIGFNDDTTDSSIYNRRVANPPYPVNPRHPTPYSANAQIGFTEVEVSSHPSTRTAPVVGAAPAAYPHPHSAMNATPYPPVAPYPPVSAPYPPVGAAPASYPPTNPTAPLAENSQLPPPTYYEATGQVSSVKHQPPYPTH